MAMAIRAFQGYTRDNVSAGHIDPRDIDIREGFNPRSSEELELGIKELMPQIIAAGRVFKPIHIGKDGPRAFLVDGETRVRCLLQLIEQRHPKFLDENWPKGRVSVPFLYDEDVASDPDIALLRALAGNEGRKLTDFDKGAAYAKFLAFGHDVDWIVANTGLTKRHILSCLELAAAPVELKQAVSEGKLSRGAAVQAVKKGSQVAREVAAKATASPTPIKRHRETSVANPASALKAAIAAILGECDQQKDVMVYEIHRNNVIALREAMG